MTPARFVLWLILGTAGLRVALAAGTGLGIDESYMVAAGRTLQVSYFDHPPLAWWISRLAALAGGSEAPVVVRLPFIALFALSTWLMFALGRRLFGERAGQWAAIGLNVSPVFSVTTASWVLPDGPLTCALLAGVYSLVRGLDGLEPRPWLWWSLAGLGGGLALLAKYSAVLVLAGAVVYLLTQPLHRRWLGRPHPYAAAAIALACLAPAVVWNARHGWVSFAFQGGRAAAASLHLWGPLVTLAGGALFVLPWIWLPLMAAWLAALRAGRIVWRSWLPACLGAGPILVFAVVSFWARHVLFHWAAPGYLMLFPLLGAWAERRTVPLLRRGIGATAVLLVLAGVVLVTEARVNLLAPFGVDPGLQATDWTVLRVQLATRGLLDRPNTVVAATNWADAGKLSYGLGGGIRVLCLSDDARQFAMSGDRWPTRDQDVLLIGPRLTANGLTGQFAARFETVDPLPPLMLRNATLPLFLGRRWRG